VKYLNILLKREEHYSRRTLTELKTLFSPYTAYYNYCVGLLVPSCRALPYNKISPPPGRKVVLYLS